MPSDEKDLSCKTVTRQQPNFIVNKEIADEIGRNCTTLPLFEKGLFEYTYVRHYSLKTNELLKCHWAKYKREYGDRVFAPFQFLDIRDYHFYNCRNRLLPAESIHTKKEFRFKLKPGPGVDHMGQMPIPQELHVKRGVDRPKLFKKRNNKNDGNKFKDNGIKEKSAENNN